MGVTEPGRFDGSAGSVGLGEKEQHHFAAAKIPQRDRIVFFIAQGKIRSRMTYFHKISRLNMVPILNELRQRHRPGVKLAGLAVIAAMLVAPAWRLSSVSAQSRGPAPRLRAIGLLTWSADPAAKTAPHLFPIAVFDNGKFYDATLYHAGSLPMALEPETVYEGQRSGTPVGFFTISSAQQVQGTWVAGGRWKLRAPESAFAKRPVFVGSDDDRDERPHLKRSPEGVASKKAPVTPSADTPVPAEQPAASGIPAGSSGSSESADPNRPVLRRGKPDSPAANASGSPAPNASAESADPDRPVLHRGKSAAETPSTVPGKIIGSASSPGKVVTPAAAGETMAAISDEQSSEPRAYAYAWRPGEEARMRGAMTSLAAAGIKKYQREHNGGAAITSRAAAALAPSGESSTRSRSRRWKSRQPRAVATESLPAFQQVQIRPFDLTASNEEVIVYSAQTRGTALGGSSTGTFVTVVARLDVEGVPRTIFSQVSDTNHLDIYPRLELVDAIDAEGSRRGDLLFHAYGAGETHYVIYKVERDQVTQVFSGASTAPAPANDP